MTDVPSQSADQSDVAYAREHARVYALRQMASDAAASRYADHYLTLLNGETDIMHFPAHPAPFFHWSRENPDYRDE